MLFKFKVLNTETESCFLGIFGDCLKIKINSANNLPYQLVNFLSLSLGIPETMIKVNHTDLKKSFFLIDLPEKAYEIIMSYI